LNWDDEYGQRFKMAMNDDFNTPEALAVLFDLATEINRGNHSLIPQLRGLGGILGLLQHEPSKFLQSAAVSKPAGQLSNAEIDERILARTNAKQSRNFAESDRIRDELKTLGIVLEDSPQGTTWRRS
jgi:cysteinyl-tRNA synthetase